jgi:beta-fructofuranosidase
MSDLLEQAQIYQEEKADKIPCAQRPDFHASSPVGWINDPNGWSVYQGEYHLFFQYHPYNIHWGPMHWGHMKTKDFIRWERMPVSLAPDMQYDKNGCFSGSAIEKNGKHILMYTGVYEEEINNKKEMYQVQCIAIGDGVKYTKIEYNPVITGKMLPEGCNVHDFRDPKIWIKDGMYYAVIGSKNEVHDGQVVIFRSKDLKAWEYVNSLDQSEMRYGAMWECPDLFELDGQDVLIASPQFMEAEGLEFHNGNGTMCVIGTVDVNSRLMRKKVHAIDYGLDFYAPQTLKATDGRRIMIAWMQSWDNYITPKEFDWSGIMSIPRVLSLKNDRLYQYPVSEIESCRYNQLTKSLTVHSGESYIQLLKGRQIDLILKIEKIDCSYFEIKLACKEEKYTKVIYEPMENTITFDRTYSGLHKDVQCTRKMKIDSFHEGMEIRILMDKYTVEMFVDGGKYAMSSLIYTDLDFDGIDFVTDGQVHLNIEKYDIIVQ